MTAGRHILLVILLMLLPATATAHTLLTAADLGRLSFHPHPGAALPLQLIARDESGAAVPLGRYFGKHPVVLVLEYLHCPGLCGVTMGNLAVALDQAALAAGRDYEVVALSIDPREDATEARSAKAQYTAQSRNAAAWHFLTADQSTIASVAEAVGLDYRYDPASDQYAHPAGFVIASPDGRIARYMLGVDYAPDRVRDAVLAATTGEVAAPVSTFLLLCFGYDPQRGPYNFAIGIALRVGVVLAIVGVAAMVVSLERARHG